MVIGNHNHVLKSKTPPPLSCIGGATIEMDVARNGRPRIGTKAFHQIWPFVAPSHISSSTAAYWNLQDTMVTKLAAKVIPVSIALAVASVGPPVWFCIACPVILGLLAPFLFNFGTTPPPRGCPPVPHFQARAQQP